MGLWALLKLPTMPEIELSQSRPTAPALGCNAKREQYSRQDRIKEA